MPPRRIIIVIAAICLTVAVAYGGFWWVVAGMIRDGITDWAEARRAEGFELSYEALAIDGFPGRIAITLTRPSVARPDSGGAAGWRWRAPRLAAEMDPFALGRIAITLPEVQRLDYGGRQIEITVARGVAVYTPPGGAPESLAVEAGGIAVASPGGRFTLDSLRGLIRRGSETVIEVEIDGRDLTLAPRTKAFLGREISVIGVTASHDGDLPEALSGPALAAWSTGGGTVEFERLNLEWGAIEIAAEGTLTLDGDLRPEAAFSAEIAGYGGLLDGLAESGRMKPRDASFAKTFLNLMAKTTSGRRVIKVALTAQNGTLYVGPLPLIRLAPVTAW
ncbi:MAG: DUF2125 domain-containing protein [Proteobacteria bacterium]|nr:DUF2125 domain-containing protein [Pseudomonadota bacterium]